MSLRERKKALTNQALVEAAHKLFGRDGFEETTVDQIAKEAGVSRRTFFRYFETKEAVVFPKHGERLVRFQKMLRGTGDGLDALGRVKRAFMDMAAAMMEDREDLLLQREIVDASAALLAYEFKLDRVWEEAIAQTLCAQAARGDAQAVRRGRLLAGALMGAVRASMQEWFSNDAQDDLVQMGEEAFALLEGGLRAALSGSSSRHLAPHTTHKTTRGAAHETPNL